MKNLLGHTRLLVGMVIGLCSVQAHSTDTGLNIEHRMNIPSLVEIAVAPEPNLTLTVSPDTIRSGTQATLSWVGHKLSGVTFSDIGYQNGLNGERGVAPTSDTTYVASGQNLHGSVQAQVSLTVLDPEPTWSVSVVPQTAFPDQPVTVKWQTQYAHEVTLEGVGIVANSGEYTTYLNSSQTFNFTVTGDDITTLESTYVSVIPRDNRTCKSLLDQDPTLPSGAYDLTIGRYDCDMTTQGGGWLRIPATELSSWLIGQTIREGKTTHHANGEVTITDSSAAENIDVRLNYRLPFTATSFMLGTLGIQDDSPTTGHTFDLLVNGNMTNTPWASLLPQPYTFAGDVAYGSVDDIKPAISFIQAGHNTNGHKANFTLPSSARLKPYTFSKPTTIFNVRVTESGTEWEGIRIHKSGYFYFR